MVAQREDDLEAYIHGRTQDLAQIINYKMLQARSDLQELALAPVFAEFPGRIRDWRYRLDDSSEQMREAFEAKLKFSAERLERTVSRLSPARLATRAAANGTRLAVLGQRQRPPSKGCRQKRRGN